MGTNFYLKDTHEYKAQDGRIYCGIVTYNEEDEKYEEDVHIGKRSAAGPYCWSCSITLCAEGPGKVHYSCHLGNSRKPGTCHISNCDGGHWFDKCPSCGGKYEPENFLNSSAARELGFNKDKPKKKTGIKSCCSFTWAMTKYDLKNFCKKSKNKKPILDEYGASFSLKEFEEILKECPIQSHSIGMEFS